TTLPDRVMMTTHDPVQANFLRRKFENDGIDVSIINLTPSSNGVRANVSNSKATSLAQLE
ncbi:hypothetical protein, partial [Vibrio tasmaniensis]|uniref:hypothetical protein n=1 Tax=Vibrio tasmaniensis TaxID=212663 RepID=UPI001A7E1A99